MRRLPKVTQRPYIRIACGKSRCLRPAPKANRVGGGQGLPNHGLSLGFAKRPPGESLLRFIRLSRKGGGAPPPIGRGRAGRESPLGDSVMASVGAASPSVDLLQNDALRAASPWRKIS